MSPQLPRKRIIGYSDKISVAPGESIGFKLSCEDIERYQADIVRLRCGDLHPDGRGLIEYPVETAVTGEYPAREQIINAGSCAVIEDSARLGSLTTFTLQAWVWPTLPAGGEQTIMGRRDPVQRRGFALEIDTQACLRFSHGEQQLSLEQPLENRQWVFVSASHSAESGEVRLWQRTQPSYPAEPRTSEARAYFSPSSDEVEVPFTLAAACGSVGPFVASQPYNGKLEAPRVFARVVDESETSQARTDPLTDVALVAAWDFALETSSQRVVDTSANALHGRLINLPARAMTSHNWNGDSHDWKRAPQHYGAIHFHQDDIYDCEWDSNFVLSVADDLPSGVYAARIKAGADEDRIPFVVLPPRDTKTADVLVLLPTASYLAYANEHAGLKGGGEMQIFANHLVALSANDLLLNERPDLGYSMYDVHADGSGVCYSSRLRPILNLRPCVTNSWVGAAGTIPWQFNADLPLLDWLENSDVAYDVATDEDLHAEGSRLLSRYRVVLTGSHPEYYSTSMHDALGGYLRDGGRLMYLGGNGFYWRVAYHPDLPGVMELRRGEDGIRDWVADPGEYYMSFSGEYGGMWQRNGRPIYSLVGVGMAGQGFDVCSYYRRTQASHHPRAAFICDGIEDEKIGDFGTVGGGAAGIEVDRFDPAKGSPPHALVVASSGGLSDNYYPGPEDIDNASPIIDGSQNPDVRADLTFFETPNGGAVFSTGSIAWIGSLSWNSFDNNVSQVTENVLRRFLDDQPFEMPD